MVIKLSTDFPNNMIRARISQNSTVMIFCTSQLTLPIMCVCVLCLYCAPAVVCVHPAGYDLESGMQSCSSLGRAS